MAGKFVLRSENDTENPFLVRFYGDGISAGRVVLYEQQGNRTAFIALISQGARFYGDTGCGQPKKIYFAGYEIPEFDGNGARNWKYHAGKATIHPVYKIVTTGLLSTDTFTVPNHGYEDNDLIAFHKRGKTAVLSAPLRDHKQYKVAQKTTNTFKVADVTTEAVIDLTSDCTTGSGGTGTIFVYRANVGLFDPEQGKPFFFPNLNFTFTQKTYIEILLPAELSNGEDEPTKLKGLLRGKQIRDFQTSGGGLLEPTGDPLDDENNARIGYDILKYDIKLPDTRFHAPSWVEWKNRCGGLISWIGGNGNPAVPIWATVVGCTVDTTLNRVTRIIPTTGNYEEARVVTQVFPEATTSMIEFKYRGGDVACHFLDNIAGTGASKQGLVVQGGLLYYNEFGAHREIGVANVTDRLKIAYENGFFKIYRNAVPVSLAGGVTTQHNTTNFYANIEIRNLNSDVDEILVAPSGTATQPRLVKRFNGDLVATAGTAAIEAFEQLISLSPGTVWQDVDGEIKVLSNPDRNPIFTFYHNPEQTLIASNIRKATLKRRSLDDTPNYWRWSFRNKDDAILSRTFDKTDRPARRSLLGRKIENGGITAYGVLTQSQMQRIGESIARRVADNDFGYDIEAFVDSLKVAKGDYVNVIEPSGGFFDENPSLQMVTGESLEHGAEVELRTFATQSITRDWYSDTAHGAVIPVSRDTASLNFIPPEPVVSIVLQESSRRLPDGTYIPEVEGTVLFSNRLNQRGKVFVKSLVGGNGVTVTLDSASDTFTIRATGEFINGNIISLVNASGNFPANITLENKFFVRDWNGATKTFKVSLTNGGSVYNFTDNGTGILKFYPWREWTYLETIFPDANHTAVFEYAPAEKGFHYFRVLPESLAGASGLFAVQTTTRIAVAGDVIAPLPPENVTYTWDGINIRWQWDSSVSVNVAGYLVRDNHNAVIFQGDATGFTMPVRADSFDIKVFAYSESGVVSATFTEGLFALPPDLDWKNISGAFILPDNSIKKNAATAWGNSGAAFSWSLLSNAPAGGRLSYTADTADEYKIFGFASTPNVNSFDDFHHAVFFHNTGAVFALWQDGGIQQLQIGTYNIGDKFAIEYLPQAVDGGGLVRIKRAFQTGEQVEYDDFYIFPELPLQFPAYAAVSLYTTDTIFAPNLKITGNICSTNGVRPTTDQIEATTYNSSTGVLTANTGDGYGKCGASFLERIGATLDGGYFFNVPLGVTAAIGICLTQPGSNPDMPLNVRFADDNSVFVYLENVEELSLGFHNGAANWSITREAGIPVIRKNGVMVFRYLAAPSDLKTQEVLLGIAFGGLINETVTGLLFRQTANSDALRSVTATFEKGRIGRNKVFDIPEFNFTDAQNGESLVWQNGKIINAVTSVLTAILTGISFASASVITAGDTVLTAFGKLQKQLSNIGTRNAANGYAGLDGSGKVDTGVLPTLAINSIQAVANQTARLALTNVQEGDAVKEADTGRVFMLADVPPSANQNWIEIADVTPDWSAVSNKPATFTPTTHTHSYQPESDALSQIASLTPSTNDLIGWNGTSYDSFTPESLRQIALNTFKNETGTTYSIIAGDNGKTLTFNNSATITVTVPASLAVGFRVRIIQKGAGIVKIVGAGGVTVSNVKGGDSTSGIYSVITLENIATNAFILDGKTSKFFAPNELGGLQMWLKADAIVGLSDGEAISTWEDSATSNFDGTQSGGNRPIYKTGILNSLPIVRFDGTNDYFNIGDFSGMSEGEIFVVLKIDTDPPAGDQTGMWSFNASDATAHYPWTDGNIYENFGTTARKTVGNPTPSLAGWRIYSIYSATNDYQAFIDGTSVFSTATNTTQFQSGGTFGRSSSIRYLDGDVAEIILYRAKLSVDNRAKVIDYLRIKYNL